MDDKKSNSQKGYEKGYAEGSAGKPSSHPGHLLDLINTKEQQAYEDGLEKGYEAGQANSGKKK